MQRFKRLIGRGRERTSDGGEASRTAESGGTVDFMRKASEQARMVGQIKERAREKPAELHQEIASMTNRLAPFQGTELYNSKMREIIDIHGKYNVDQKQLDDDHDDLIERYQDTALQNHKQIEKVKKGHKENTATNLTKRYLEVKSVIDSLPEPNELPAYSESPSSS